MTSDRTLHWLLGLGGLLLLGQVGLLYLSGLFDSISALWSQPIPHLTVLLVAMGLAFLLMPKLIAALSPRPELSVIVLFLGMGLAMRLILLPSTAVLETDFYRYLWDGGVLWSGGNPWRWSPDEALSQPLLAELAQSFSGFSLINHPEFTTIYPGVAQLIFALSWALAPGSLEAWRLILLAADLVSLILLWRLLQVQGRSPYWLLAYWWNPLVLYFGFATAHMDLLLLPFLLGALLMASQGRAFRSLALLGLAGGVKIWPVLLLPLFLRSLWGNWGRLLLGAAAFLVPFLVATLPMVWFGAEHNSGLAGFSRAWAANDLLYLALGHWLGELEARLILVFIVGLVALGAAWKPLQGQSDLSGRMLLVVAALFCLSPVQFPWYAIWFLPLLALHQVWGLWLLSCTLLIYPLRFYFASLERPEVYDHGLVWLIWLPVWVAFAWQFRHSRERRATA